MILLSNSINVLCIIRPTHYICNYLLIIANIMITKCVNTNIKIDNTKSKVNNSVKFIRTSGIFTREHPKHSIYLTKNVFNNDSIRRNSGIPVSIIYRQLSSPGVFLWNDCSTNKILDLQIIYIIIFQSKIITHLTVSSIPT